MRITFAILLSALLVYPNFAQPTATQEQKAQSTQAGQTTSPPLKQPLAFGLEDGTPIRLRLTRNLSSADAKTGDRVDFEVLEDVKVKDAIIIPRGGIAWGTVTEAQAKRRMGRGGKLDVNIDDVRLLDGEKAPLRAVKEVKGGGHTGAMTGAMVGTAIVFFPAAPLFLFMHGKDITIPKGTEITAYINGDTRLEEAKFQPAKTDAPAAPAQTGPSDAEIEISSIPPGADIELDGKFVGSTPSSITVAPGDHEIAIKKTGFAVWDRKTTVSSGHINITAELIADSQ